MSEIYGERLGAYVQGDWLQMPGTIEVKSYNGNFAREQLLLVISGALKERGRRMRSVGEENTEDDRVINSLYAVPPFADSLEAIETATEIATRWGEVKGALHPAIAPHADNFVPREEVIVER